MAVRFARPLAACFAFCLVGAQPGWAATFVVNDLGSLPDLVPGDGTCATAAGTCTLQAALAEANASASVDRVELPDGVFSLPFPHGVLRKPVEIVGAGRALSVLDGGGASSRILDADANLTLEALTVRNSGGVHASKGFVVRNCDFVGNHATNAGGALECGGATTIENSRFIGNRVSNSGGAIHCDGSLDIATSRFQDNSAGNVGGAVSASAHLAVGWSEFISNDAFNTGGAIHSDAGTTKVHDCTFEANEGGNVGGAIVTKGPLEVGNSTFSGNRAGGSGAAIDAHGPAELLHVTVTGSSATCFSDPNCYTILAGGAVFGNAITIGNSILYGNQETDCEGSFFSLGGNFFGDTSACLLAGNVAADRSGVDPMLAPLADNGGPTRTQALLSGSPAIDSGVAGPCLPGDQRGILRPQGPACDAGSFEALACNFDGVLDPFEQCDDGNQLDGDGCSATCETELLSGRGLSISQKGGVPSGSRLSLMSRDPRLALGRGNLSVDDPTLYGATVRVMSATGSFDDTYVLPAQGWSYVGKRGEGRGYRYRSKTGPIRSVVVRPGKRLRVRGKGALLGHDLSSDPGSVYTFLRIGERLYCAGFGGEVRFVPGRRFKGSHAPPPLTVPGP